MANYDASKNVARQKIGRPAIGRPSAASESRETNRQTSRVPELQSLRRKNVVVGSAVARDAEEKSPASGLPTLFTGRFVFL
jgi:hypothetical protein